MPEANQTQRTLTIPARVATELLPQLSKSKLKLVLEVLNETYEAGYRKGLEDGQKGAR